MFTTPTSKLSATYPSVVHVVPLHALRTVIAAGALYSAEERRVRGIRISRRSTAVVDEALGVHRFVHLYLLPDEPTADSWSHLAPESAPILAHKLVKRRPAFPHVALAMSTASVCRPDALASAWNVGRSKPGVGFFRNDESADDRVRVWREFRKKHKNNDQKLKGRVRPSIEVPLLSLVDATRERTSAAQSRLKELLIPDCLDLPPSMTIWVFSNADRERAIALLAGLPRQQLRVGEISGYPSPHNLIDSDLWATVLARRDELLDLDFD